MEAEDGHAEEMVLVVNTINRRTQQIPRSECDLFLRKHKLFRLVVADIPEEEKKRKSKKVSKKPTKPVKEEKVAYQRYVNHLHLLDHTKEAKESRGLPEVVSSSIGN
jgi:hypothetical protein